MRGSIWQLGALLAAAAACNTYGLQWEKREHVGETKPLEVTADVVFAFKNDGAAPVRIRSVQTNCDCLEAKSDKAVYAPGESGRVTARFTVGDRLGLYSRSVMVVTDEPEPLTRLTVAIEVPAPAEIAPRNLSWAIDGKLDERVAQLEVAAGLHIEFSEAISTDENFAVRLEQVEPGRRYRVHVTPKTVTAPASGAIRIRGKASSGQDVRMNAYVRIER